MSHLERSIEIQAERATVWMTVADLEAVVDWNPNVVAAHCGGTANGIGATRVCHLAPTGHLDEVVSEWIEGEQIWFAIGSHGAIRSADMGLVLDRPLSPLPDPFLGPHGGPPTTLVTAIIDYHLAFGPLGPVIDRLTVKRLMARMLDTSLTGLKHHIEANNPPSTARLQGELS